MPARDKMLLSAGFHSPEMAAVRWPDPGFHGLSMPGP